MLIKMGIVATGASGSSGGITASHNRFGAYVRSRTTPVNPNTDRQQSARTNFSAAAAAWSQVLTGVQREAWDQYAASISWLNALGQEVFLTGFNMFLRSAASALNAGLAIVAPGPVILTLPESDPTFAVTASEATQLLSVAFDDTLAWANEDEGAMSVTMGEPKGVGRNFLGGPFRFAGVILGDGITPPTSPTTITAPFLIAEDQQVDVNARIIRADGRVSQPFWDNLVIAA